jgi:tetratricopeptide (TPR) repeat protein
VVAKSGMGFAYSLNPRLMHPRIGFKKHICFIALIVGCAGVLSVKAQIASSPTDSSSGASIRGRVALPSGGFLSEGVRISLSTIRGVEASVYTDNSGRFEFTRLSPGHYQVSADADRDRYEIVTESVELVRNQPVFLSLVLKEKEQAGRPKAGTLSATELDSNIPEKARKEFERASSLNREGKTEQAIAHLRKAIEFYPRYLMAYNDLGAQLLDLGRLEEAEEALRRALSIDSGAFNPSLNLGILLFRKHRFAEAQTTLEKAVSLQAQSPAARLYYGLALAATSEIGRAEKELTTAYDLGGHDYAVALFHLGQLYMDRGDRNRARDFFQRYLREAPNASNSAQVRKLIAMLE